MVASLALAATGTNTRVSSHNTGRGGFMVEGTSPDVDAYVEGFGSAQLVAVDREGRLEAAHGDEGSLEATFSPQRGGTYRVELSAPGFQVRGGYGAAGERVGGGVLIDVQAHGAGGWGLTMQTPTRAAVVVQGVGRVYLNGKLLTGQARVFAAAHTAGAHADDSSHKQLREARAEDAELEIFATGLPTDQVPGGFVRFFFDDVRIEVNGLPAPAALTVSSVPLRNPEEAAAQASGAASVPVAPAYPPTGAALPQETLAQGTQGAGSSATPGTASTQPGSIATPAPLTSQQPPAASGISPLNASPASPGLQSPTPLNASQTGVGGSGTAGTPTTTPNALPTPTTTPGAGGANTVGTPTTPGVDSTLGTGAPGSTTTGTSPGTTPSPGVTMPGSTAPGATTVPGTTPGTTAPGTTTPGTTTPGTTAPGTTPGTTAPGSSSGSGGASPAGAPASGVGGAASGGR
jgi:hypothetical protein